MTGGRVHTDFKIGAIIKGDPRIDVDKKAEGRKLEFESFFNTMYPICSKYSNFIINLNKPKGSNSGLTEQDDVILNKNIMMSFMQMGLQIWVAKLVRNQ